MRALAVAIVKSSVPRGENSSKKAFDSAMTRARAIHAAGRSWAKTAQRQRASGARKAAQVPAIDFRLTSPRPHTRSFCFPKSEPMISEEASEAVEEPQTKRNSIAKVRGGKRAPSWAP